MYEQNSMPYREDEIYVICYDKACRVRYALMHNEKYYLIYVFLMKDMKILHI